MSKDSVIQMSLRRGNFSISQGILKHLMGSTGWSSENSSWRRETKCGFKTIFRNFAICAFVLRLNRSCGIARAWAWTREWDICLLIPVLAIKIKCNRFFPKTKHHHRWSTNKGWVCLHHKCRWQLTSRQYRTRSQVQIWILKMKMETMWVSCSVSHTGILLTCSVFRM